MVLLVGAVLALVPPATGAADAPVAAAEHAVRVDDVTPRLLRVGDRLVGGSARTDPFVLIGATFASARPHAGRVRVRIDGQWGAWLRLTDEDGQAAPKPGSDPIWVGEATGYQLSLPADATGVEAHLVRETAVVVAEAEPAPAALSAAESAPTIRRREAWGARPYRGQVVINRRLRLGVVHHTDNANDYGPGQVPAMLRAIQAYHQDSRGWPDIAYNFLVDRFGRIWEGRDRSYEAKVRASATSGTTHGTVTVAFLGDATSVAPPSVAVRAIGRTLGWKLRKHGVRPTRDNIVGHRDLGQSTCPGDALYARLGVIRRVAINST